MIAILTDEDLESRFVPSEPDAPFECPVCGHLQSSPEFVDHFTESDSRDSSRLHSAWNDAHLATQVTTDADGEIHDLAWDLVDAVEEGESAVAQAVGFTALWETEKVVLAERIAAFLEAEEAEAIATEEENRLFLSEEA